MTKEQIKDSVTVAEVLQRYGITVPRSRYISCPFHKEKTASCYIEKKSFHCFGCGAHGDVFALVQMMEGVSFKEAFLSLGGIYEKPLNRKELYAQKLRMAEIKRLQDVKDNEIRACKKRLAMASREIEVWRPYLSVFEPMSEDWQYAMDKFCRAMNSYDACCEEIQELTT